MTQPQHTEPTDADLLREVAAGASAPFVELVQRHHGAVNRFVRAAVGPRTEVEDIVQDTFMEALTSARNFEGSGSARAWLIGIARHRISRQFRRRVDEPEHFEPLDELGLRAGWGNPEAEAIHQEAAERIQEALDRLPRTSQEVLLLRDVEGFTNPEVSEILGISLASVKSRVHRARLSLMAELQNIREDIDG